MSNYSDDEAMVRVDFFKQSGKWYTTEAVKFVGYNKDTPIHTAFRNSLKLHFESTGHRLGGMKAVCLEPYHESSHPLMINVDSIYE